MALGLGNDKALNNETNSLFLPARSDQCRNDGDDFSPTDTRNGPFRTGQQRRDFNRCRGSGAAKGDDDLESDSDV